MKHRYLKLVALILAGLLIATVIYILTQSNGLFAGSGADYTSNVQYPTTPITLTYWLPSDEAGYLDAVITNYKKVHPNVSIDIKYIDPTTYQQQLLQAQSAGTLPDIFGFRNDGLPLYKNSLTPAPASVITTGQFNQIFAEFASSKLVTASTIYGMPFGIATLGLIYNSDGFNQAKVEPPTTWQQFDNVNNLVRNKQGANLYASGTALGTATIHNYPDIISMFMMQNGATMTDTPPTKATFELADTNGYYAGSKALDYYASFSQPTKANYSWSDSLGTSINAFAGGKTQMIIDYSTAIKTITKQNPSIKYKVAALPQVNPDNPLNYGVIFTQGVAKTSKNTEIAWDFLGFATSKKQQQLYSQASLWPASRKDLIIDQLNDKDLAPFAKQTSTANDWYKGINYATNAHLRDMIVNYFAGYDSKISVNLASAAITTEIAKSNQ